MHLKHAAFLSSGALPILSRIRTLKPPPTTKLRTLVVCKEGNSGIRPKQSLGQNFLRDRNIIRRIVDEFSRIHSSQHPDTHVVEVGPGLGALTGELINSVNDLHAIEIDQRAVAHLRDLFPLLSVEHGDVLQTDWGELSEKLGAPLSVIGNLPYNIVSQILFSLLESPEHAVRFAVVMMQREVAQRIVAQPRTKAYGILSVVAQLYARPTILFSVPPTAFYPVPEVMSAMVQLDFTPHPEFNVGDSVLTAGLRTILKNAFGQRRKVLRNSLKAVCQAQEVDLPFKWEDKRAEELYPIEFVDMTQILFHKQLEEHRSGLGENQRSRTVWR